MKPITVITLILTLSVTCFMSFAANATKQGTESGGGGGVVWIDSNRPILMDFYTIIKTASELPVLVQNSSYIDDTKTAPISISDENEAAVKAENTAFAYAIDTLEKWKKLPFDSMSFFVLISFRNPLQWSFTDNTLEAPPFYLAANLPSHSPTEVSAYYLKKTINTFSVTISRNIWNQMKLLDQAGLLIHETLRQMQIGFGNGYNDESLQRATAIYSLCKPTGRLNYYMFYLLNNSPKEADRIYGSFDQFIEKECKRLP
jgi:hypothetical protein